MADITMCNGLDCPVKEECKRFTATPDARQVRFSEMPCKIENAKFYCQYYWGTNSEIQFGIPLK